MFKFNFDLEQKPDQTESINDKKLSNSDKLDETYFYKSVGVISYEDLIEKRPEKLTSFKNLNLSNKCKLELIDSSKVVLDQKDELSKINETHDVVPGKYEGGLKLWELSIDLAKFIYFSPNFGEEKLRNLGFGCKEIQDLKKIGDFFNYYLRGDEKKELRILELGCGHALPVLAILKMIEEKLENEQLSVVIYLQDFNEQIIRDISLENMKNFFDNSNLFKKIKFKCNFVHGDWQCMYLKKSLPESYFDLILTSETIYNSANYRHLLNLFQLCLKNCNDELIKLSENTQKNSSAQSMVLLSAKTYYFGCGGNILEFKNEAKSSNYSFETSQNLLYDDLINEKLIHIAQEDEEQVKQNLGLIDTHQISIISKEIIKINR